MIILGNFEQVFYKACQSKDIGSMEGVSMDVMPWLHLGQGHLPATVWDGERWRLGVEFGEVSREAWSIRSYTSGVAAL